MNPKVKLLLLIPHLGGGGAERVVAQLARQLNPDSFEIHLGLITQDLPGAEEVSPLVKVHRFGCRRVRWCWWHLVKLAWQQQPDVLFSGMAHLNFLALLLRWLLPRKMQVVVRQNTTASKAGRGWMTRCGYRYLYPTADVIVCQSESMADDLAAGFGVGIKIGRSKIRVLRNPVDLGCDRSKDGGARNANLWPDGAWPRLLSVGRLSPEKGFDLLIGAVERLRLTYPRIHAIVLGEGDERFALEKLSGQLGLDNAVSFPGHQRGVSGFYRGTTLFVLPSRYEGMPNALLEAAACGLPVVATRCSGGVTEILEGARGAWLADAITADSLAEAISKALGDLGDCMHAPHRFEHLFLEPFESGRAIEAYANLFLSLVPETRAWLDD